MMLVFLYFLFIFLADLVAARWMLPVIPWYGVVAPAGVVFVGPVLTLRDQLHDKLGTRGVISVILVASVFAWVVGGVTSGGLLQAIAVASALAFTASELVADTGVYAALQHRSWLTRVLASNAVSAPVDSVLFIGLAFGLFIGRSFWGGRRLMMGQTIAKIVFGALWAIGWKKLYASIVE